MIPAHVVVELPCDSQPTALTSVCVELAFKGVLCTCLGSRGGSLRHGFFPFMLMDPNKRQTAVCGCYFLHDMAVHMRGLVYVCPCLHCFQGNFHLCICRKLL